MQLLSPAPTRYVLLVVGDAWAPPAEVVRCRTAEAAICALETGRRYSTVVTAGVSRDAGLAAAARRAGVPVLTAIEAGADLAARCMPVPRVDQPPALDPAPAASSPGCSEEAGRLVAVCGPGGTGASVVAAALAGDVATQRTPGAPGAPGAGKAVLLADLALQADQAFLHGVAEPGTGLLHLADAARYRSIEAAQVQRHTVAVALGRLLPGLERPHHWTAVRPAAFDNVLATLLSVFDVVVADVTGELEGEVDSGSIDLEERNHMARRATATADVVVAVGGPGRHGARRLALLVDELLDHGVDPARIQPVVNRVSLPPAPHGVCGLPARPVALADVAGLDGLLPAAVIQPLAAAVEGILSDQPPPPRGPDLVRVAPGSLGSDAW